MGLPEGTEGTDMVSYLENWFKSVVAPEGLSTFYTLERAHRVPARPFLGGPKASGGPSASLPRQGLTSAESES